MITMATAGMAPTRTMAGRQNQSGRNDRPPKPDLHHGFETAFAEAAQPDRERQRGKQQHLAAVARNCAGKGGDRRRDAGRQRGDLLDEETRLAQLHQQVGARRDDEQ